jgi:hypothetical protein
MARRPAVVAERPALSPAKQAKAPPQPQPAPRWMTWAPLAAVAWALAYGSVRTWWAVGNAPSFPPKGTDLIVFTGWRAVGLCAAAVGITLALRTAPWRRALFIAAWVVSAALLAASAALLLDVIEGCFLGAGSRFTRSRS